MLLQLFLLNLFSVPHVNPGTKLTTRLRGILVPEESPESPQVQLIYSRNLLLPSFYPTLHLLFLVPAFRSAVT